jgi:hypothetical protein
MRNERRARDNNYFPVVGVVFAFMALSLAISATGTARFAAAMGYRAEVGYGVGVIFDLAKELLPIALVTLFARRAYLFFVIIGFAWLGLVTYSALATEATVSTAIATIERNGTWKTEARSGTRAELAAIEKRLDVLSQPLPPRPIKSLVEALAVEKVPPGVWRDSQECQNIRDSKYFQAACTTVLGLRRELAAARDYEQLDAQAGKLRQALAGMPLVAMSDPLPEAFAATLGRLLLLDGRVGVSLLLTFVIEIMSCFGLAALGALALGDALTREDQYVARSSLHTSDGGTAIGEHNRSAAMLPQGPSQIIPGSSLTADNVGISSARDPIRDKRREDPSNVIPLRGTGSREPRVREGMKMSPISRRSVLGTIGNHVPEFVRQCLKSVPGTSLGASELRAAYQVWCEDHNYEPLAQRKLGAELKGFGFAKWKSCGLIRYRDLQLVA